MLMALAASRSRVSPSEEPEGTTLRDKANGWPQGSLMNPLLQIWKAFDARTSPTTGDVNFQLAKLENKFGF